ncbi:hypothetical protein OO015_08050 [Thermomicrobium sp. 4228-Ro]|uniref:DUF7680 family protein n=1 Tax=Thermomicrobium sp. 4228-Ro TaxID=2993937 RepID=UPI0022491CE1|nr:hypothetical protein [Thermomicrobium sp. 4228-Ro]MCX2727444.1 hypothetical protein [Thermomicrobium sp. 4228-Ro]
MSDDRRWRFQLRVQPLGDEAYRLIVLQQRPASNGRRPTVQRVAALDGTPLLVALDQVLELLRRDGYRSLRDTRASGGEDRMVALSEATGVRLGLLFLALRPLRRVERMERVAAGVRAMTDEEAYYWFSKCVAPGTGYRARRALRILVAGE